jgi:hypothetical protein
METVDQRIEYLMQRQHIGSAVLKKIKGLPFRPNCHGTSLFILGKRVSGNEKSEKGHIRHITLPNMPAYVEPYVMEEFLEQRCNILPAPRIGSIATFWSHYHDAGIKYILEHSGILINEETSTLFHQENIGKPFMFSTVDYCQNDLPFIEDGQVLQPRFYELKR